MVQRPRARAYVQAHKLRCNYKPGDRNRRSRGAERIDRISEEKRRSYGERPSVIGRGKQRLVVRTEENHDEGFVTGTKQTVYTRHESEATVKQHA